MKCSKENVVAYAYGLLDRNNRNEQLRLKLKFSNRQMDVVRCKQIGQANIVGDECSDDTQGTTSFGDSAVKLELDRSSKTEIERTLRSLRIFQLLEQGM